METEILVLIIVIVVLSGLIHGGFSLAPWIPTWAKDLERLNKFSNLKKGQNFLEVGCGDGRVSRYIADKNTDCFITGIEIAWPIYLFARAKLFLYPQKNLRLTFGNALKIDFSKYDVIYFYGLTKTFEEKIKPKLESELKPGAKFVSYAFKLSSWKGKVLVDKPTKNHVSIFVYEK